MLKITSTKAGQRGTFSIKSQTCTTAVLLVNRSTTDGPAVLAIKGQVRNTYVEKKCQNSAQTG
jgi:hypothetical protein